MTINLIFKIYSIVGKIDIGRVRLNFWDLGGQEELQSLWDKVNLLIDCCSSEKYFTYIHAYFIYNITTTKHHRYTVWYYIKII